MNNRFEELYNLIAQQFEGFSMLMFLLVIAVGISVVYVGMLLYEKKNCSKIAKRKKIVYIGLVIYLSFLFQITYFEREPGSRWGVVTSLYDIPLYFQDVEQIVYQVLNVVLFIPFGIILAEIFRGICKWKKIVVIAGSSYILSLLIELTQLLSKRGYFEVTDLLMNVFGGLIGGVLGSVLKKD